MRKEITNFKQERISINNKFRDQKLKETNSLVSSLNNILANYAEKNSISLIIQKKNIVIGKSELDITKDVLDIFNSEVKSIIKLNIMSSENKLNKDQIRDLLPHREPMLLIDELINIKKLHSATAIMNVKKDGFYVQGHFPDNPVMPGVLIVEAFGQAAAALTAAGIDKKEYENKLVFLMSVEKARFRNPVIPDCKLELNIEAIRSHGRVWKYKGEAFVDGKKMADAQWSATIVDRK